MLLLRADRKKILYGHAQHLFHDVIDRLMAQPKLLRQNRKQLAEWAVNIPILHPSLNDRQSALERKP